MTRGTLLGAIVVVVSLAFGAPRWLAYRDAYAAVVTSGVIHEFVVARGTVVPSRAWRTCGRAWTESRSASS